MMRLFHYTCSHAARRIGAAGTLEPHRQVALGDVALVWATTDPRPTRSALGLTSTILRCDRLERRYIIGAADPPFVPWATLRHTFDPTVVAALEHGRRPERWWVSAFPAPARRDRTWNGPH